MLQLKYLSTGPFRQRGAEWLLKFRTRFPRTLWIHPILYWAWDSPKCLAWLILLITWSEVTIGSCPYIVLTNYEVNLLFRILSSFVYKLVISKLFLCLTCPPSLLYESLNPGCKVDVPPAVHRFSVWGFVVPPWPKIFHTLVANWGCCHVCINILVGILYGERLDVIQEVVF